MSIITAPCGRNYPHPAHDYYAPGPFWCEGVEPVEPALPLSELVSTTVRAGERVGWADVNTVEFRDTIDGVRFTAHYGRSSATGWIVQHADHRADTDGRPVYRSHLYHSYQAMSRAWDELRRSLQD